jgi:signal transduction histidine kinase
MLANGSNNERFQAAKALVRCGLPEDLTFLMGARRRESDRYVLRWLDMAIMSCSKKAAIDSASKLGKQEGVFSLDEREQIKTQAIEWVASAVLHELGSKIGLLVAAATREFPNYQGSDTQRHVHNLDKIFEGVSELRKATAAPRSQEFDLALLIEDIVAVETDGSGIDLSLVGRKPLSLISDAALLRLALCNGIRNAVEAVKTLGSTEDQRVVVTWEVTDNEYWISVIDHGPGLAGPSEAVFEIGRTNKTGHAGFGLAIARQAMEKLGGHVSLSQSTAGGATYEIRGRLAA